MLVFSSLVSQMHASTSCVFRKQAEIDPTVEDAPVKAAKFALRLITVSIFLEDVLPKLCHVSQFT